MLARKRVMIERLFDDDNNSKKRYRKINRDKPPFVKFVNKTRPSSSIARKNSLILEGSPLLKQNKNNYFLQTPKKKTFNPQRRSS